MNKIIDPEMISLRSNISSYNSEMKPKFVTRCKIYEDGTIKEIKVPGEESDKLIN